MLTNAETRELIKKMKDCGIKPIEIRRESGIDESKFHSFLYSNCKLEFKYLILVLGYIEYAYPWFLEELDDETNYGQVIEAIWFNSDDASDVLNTLNEKEINE
jgi:hypothetical protein